MFLSGLSIRIFINEINAAKHLNFIVKYFATTNKKKSSQIAVKKKIIK